MTCTQTFLQSRYLSEMKIHKGTTLAESIHFSLTQESPTFLKLRATSSCVSINAKGY